MCLNDSVLIADEYKNQLIECLKVYIFMPQSSSSSSQQTFSQQFDNNYSTESIYMQLLMYWMGILNDSKNLANIHIPFVYALYTIKSIYVSSGYKLKIFYLFNSA